MPLPVLAVPALVEYAKGLLLRKTLSSGTSRSWWDDWSDPSSWFSGSENSAETVDPASIRLAQKNIDEINAQAQFILDGKMRKAYEQVRRAALEREGIWLEEIPKLQKSCLELKAASDFFAKNRKICGKAQAQWALHGELGLNNNKSQKSDSSTSTSRSEEDFNGCARPEHVTTVKRAFCDTMSLPLFCTQAGKAMRPENLDVTGYFAPGGKCYVGAEAGFNRPVLEREELLES